MISTLSPDQQIRQFRRRLATLLLLHNLLPLTTFWFFVWGTAVLVLRAGFGIPSMPLLLGGFGLLVVGDLAAIRMRRQMPSLAALRAAFDERSGCGGLLMAEDELRLGAWRGALPALATPSLQWRGQRAAALLMLGLTFLVVSFLVPPRLGDFINGPRLEIGADIDALTHKVMVLKEERLLDEKRADALMQKLDQLRDKASGRDPAQALEALDHVAETVMQMAREAQEAGLRKKDRLDKAKGLADALKKTKDELEPKTLSRAMAELAALTRKAAEEDQILAENLEKSTQNGESGSEKGEVDPAKLDELAKALENAKGDLDRKLTKLAEEGLLDPEALRAALEKGEFDAEELMAYLKKNDGAEGLAAMMAAMPKSGGRGGVSDDLPGNTPLTFGDESSAEGVKFKEEKLPPAALAELKKSQLNGLSRAEPKTGNSEGATSGALGGASTGGGSATTNVVLPRYRGAVERYFDRPAKPQ